MGNQQIDIQIPADMTIYEAGELKELFESSLSAANCINVSLNNVTEIDTAGIQLMVSLKKNAARDNKVVNFTAHSSAVVSLLDLFDMTTYFGDPIVIEK
ncbi:MAG: STAS domain-containing protein [Gammaproteobacteria bacterium]|nr:STAS domain-containing protein [Gammaproteobacteria bacterium]